MKVTIERVGELAVIAAALEAHIKIELDAKAAYAHQGKTVLEGVCENNINEAASIQEQILTQLGRCETHLTFGCSDPMPHTICEI